jgi:hypothetical protein
VIFLMLILNASVVYYFDKKREQWVFLIFERYVLIAFLFKKGRAIFLFFIWFSVLVVCNSFVLQFCYSFPL